jgi:hypothetical protein
MTTQELIMELAKYPPTAEVFGIFQGQGVTPVRAYESFGGVTIVCEPYHAE